MVIHLTRMGTIIIMEAMHIMIIVRLTMMIIMTTPTLLV